jgi:hypothetical protein
VTFNAATGTLQPGAPVRATLVTKNAYTLGNKAAPGTADTRMLNTCMSNGLDVDQSNGDVYLAVADFKAKASPAPRGRILVGRSADGGATWKWSNLPAMPPIDGRVQSSYRPTLVADQQSVFVGFHVLADVPLGSTSNPNALVGTAYAVSYNRANDFTAPVLVAPTRWHPNWLDGSRNGAGLRDRAELAGAGKVVYAYADGRFAAAKPSSAWGRCQIYGALISHGRPDHSRVGRLSR